MNEIVKEIRNEFVNEAKNSPTLLSDLAHMEKYISESYDGRSLIELLQNADDVLSTKFYLQKIDDNSFLVANNGREFTREDLIALCRSGASTKKRKSDTIGFRGIGFKSVVNYSNIVHLISGDIRITFSKELTKQVIENDINVPLIRIPHEFTEDKYNSIINKIIKDGYNTIFIFETNKSTLKQEINSFDNTCMLFLKSIEQIIFQYDNYQINNINRKTIDDNHTLININTKDNINQWLIYNNGKNKINNIAFKYEENKVTDTNSNENLIHSFMPTNDKFLIPCKINGDFSTDPSRTKVIIDEETNNTIDEISSLFSELIINIFKNEEDTYNILPTISRMKLDPLSTLIGKNINNFFFDNIKNKFLDSLFSITKNKKIFIQPIWFSDDDLDLINTNGIYIIKREIIERLDGLLSILELFGIKQLDINSLLEESTTIEFSNSTRINIIKHLITKYEFNMPNNIKELTSKALLFESKNGITKIMNIKKFEDIDDNMISELNEIVGDTKKIEHFFQKFNIKVENTNNAKVNVNNLNKQNYTYSKKRVIKKWRSVEENAKLLLEENDDIIKVNDVSLRNIGYDLEATYKDGSKKFYEIKSVKDFGETFSITNNEYLTAMKNPKEYNLLIVKQNDTKIEALIINDPIATLEIEKRIKSFEWICNSYSGVKIERDLDE